MTPDLSIIIPAYKEADRIGKTLETLAEFLKSRHYGEVEVVVMSDGDQATADAAKAQAGLFKNLRVVHLEQRSGKGGAVRAGMFEATGRYRIFMDADLATPLHHLDEVHAYAQQGVKVIIGVRDLVRIHKGLMRKLISKTANLVVQVLVLPGIKDSQCGFKCFEAEAAEEIFSRQTLTQWSFDVEILKIARLLGYQIHTVELPDWKDPKGEGKGLVGDSPLKVALTEVQDPIKIRLNVWAGKYKEPSFRYASKD